MYIYSVNIWAVLVAAIGTMILGMVWYGPLFGKKWAHLNGFSQDPKNHKGAGKAYALMAVSALVMSYVLAVLHKNLFIITPYRALEVAFFAWLGFVATTMSAEYIFTDKPKSWILYVINSGYYLFTFFLISLVVFLMR